MHRPWNGCCPRSAPILLDRIDGDERRPAMGYCLRRNAHTNPARLVTSAASAVMSELSTVIMGDSFPAHVLCLFSCRTAKNESAIRGTAPLRFEAAIFLDRISWASAVASCREYSRSGFLGTQANLSGAAAGQLVRRIDDYSPGAMEAADWMRHRSAGRAHDLATSKAIFKVDFRARKSEVARRRRAKPVSE